MDFSRARCRGRPLLPRPDADRPRARDLHRADGPAEPRLLRTRVRALPHRGGALLFPEAWTHLDELRLVFDDRFARRLGPLTPRVLDLFERFLRCGDPHFGFLRLRCETCAHERLLPFSSKARGLCPSCGKRRATEWALRFVETVLPAPRIGDDVADDRAPISSLPVSSLPDSSLPISSITEPPLSYLPLVFTIPKMLRPAFLFDRRLSRLLCRAAYASVRDDFARRFPHLDRPVPAFIAAPQSFGNLLTFHPHVHALVSAGVFDRDGLFHPIPADEATARLRALELPFRDAVLDAFLRRGTIDDDRAELLRSWQHSGARSTPSEPSPPAMTPPSPRSSSTSRVQRSPSGGSPSSTPASSSTRAPSTPASAATTNCGPASSSSPISSPTSSTATSVGSTPTARSRPRSGSASVGSGGGR